MQPTTLHKATFLFLISLVVGVAGVAPVSSRPSPGDECRGSASTAWDKASYEFIPLPERAAAWTGINQAHHLRLSFSAEGVRILPLTPGRPMWEWGFFLRDSGRSADGAAPRSALPIMTRNRIDLGRETVKEWFINSEKGLQHGVEVPAWEEPGIIALDFSAPGNLTPKVAEDGQSVEFVDRRGAPVLVYRELRAQDAGGRDVTVRWERVEGGRDPEEILRLIVQGTEHLYPLRILGWLATPKGLVQSGAAASDAASQAPAAPPSNDLCGGAEVIPGTGPFPYLSGTYDVTDAGTLEDPPVPTCQSNLSRSIWFEFTPTVSGGYTFSLCPDAPTATTLDDTVLAVYTAAGHCVNLTEVESGCDDDSCGGASLQSVIQNLELAAGTTYYILAWKFGITAPPVGFADVQLQVVQEPPPPGPPPNDQCSGAEMIPGDGPFPYLTSVTADIGGAKTAGDPPLPSCQSNVSRSIWYSFTPASSGRFTFSVCADAPTATTVDDTVMALYAGAGPCAGLSQIAGACDDDSCLGEANQSVIRDVSLGGGTTYYVVVWKYDLPPPAAGNTAVQLRVIEEIAPANDTCAGAQVLLEEEPISGTTVNAGDDYRLPAGSSCFTGIGQTASTAPGGEVAYRFTAPQDGSYSFRVTGYELTKNAVLYVASDCPPGGPPATIAACLQASNRNTGLPGEEVDCLNLSQSQTVYVYVDETGPSLGSPFTIEVTDCTIETEPNDLPAAATTASCGIEGSISPGGDADFFALGIPEVDSRVFALTDGVASNSNDYDLRVTTDLDTLEYDDLNNDTAFGSLAPNVSGTPVTGVATYLRVSHFGPTSEVEPYRLYGALQPPFGNATPEVEPNDTVATASGSSNFYYTGLLSSETDVDLFAFTADSGNLMQIGLDLDPTRDNTPFNGTLSLLDSSGSALLTVNDTGTVSSTAPGNGNLAATTPTAPGEAIVYRISTPGTYYARVAWSSGLPGDYLLSIAHDCRVSPPTDLTVSQTDAPDPVTPGGQIDYSLTVTNQGPEVARVVTLSDDLPAGSTLLTVTPSQGQCSGSGPVLCHLGSLAAGAHTTVALSVSAPGATGTIQNLATVGMAVVDLIPGNDASLETTTVGGPLDSDGDGVPDTADCATGQSSAWSIPGEATDLTLVGEATTTLQWTEPSDPGGTVVNYDLLRSETVDDFLAPACVASDTTLTVATDTAPPTGVHYYLVRSENVCGGNLGTHSDGTPRSAGLCP